MQIYHFDRDTGEYLATGVADPDPMVPGEYLIPAHATADAPPSVPAGKAAVYQDGSWSLIDDQRGTVYWLKHEDGSVTVHQLEILGAELPSGASLTELLADVTDADVNLERARRIRAGATFPLVGYGTVRVEGRDIDKENLQALAFAAQLNIAAGNGTQTTRFRDADNVIHELTQPQMLDLWAQATAYVSAVFEASWAIKDDFETIPTDFTDNAYWP